MFKNTSTSRFCRTYFECDIRCCRKLWDSNNNCYSFNENNYIPFDIETGKVNEKNEGITA